VDVRVAVAERQTQDAFVSGARLDRAQEVAEGDLAFAAHDEVGAVCRVCVLLGREARVISPDDDAHPGPKRAHEPDEAMRGAPLKGHHGEPHDVGCPLAHQALHGLPDLVLHEHEIGCGHAMMFVHVASERSERAVRHPDRERRHVLEGVRHREKQHVHDIFSSAERGTPVALTHAVHHPRSVVATIRMRSPSCDS
jgi:hypothetical protein